MGTQLGKFRATLLGEGMRAGWGGVNVEPITSPLWPVGPCALPLISPVPALAHCAPSLAALRATKACATRLASAPRVGVLPPPLAATTRDGAGPTQKSDLLKGSYQHEYSRPLPARKGRRWEGP